MSNAKQPSPEALKRIRAFVAKYRQKTGTFAHPDSEIGEAVINGLAQHMDELGCPLCPCRFYVDKEQEAQESRRWKCSCDWMKRYKYCHCQLFTDEDGNPITEYLPEDHEGRQIYGEVKDPTPDRGREGRSSPLP